MTSKSLPIAGIGGGFNKPADGTLSVNHTIEETKPNKNIIKPTPRHQTLQLHRPRRIIIIIAIAISTTNT